MTETTRSVANFFINCGPVLAAVAVWVLMVWESVLDEVSVRRWALYLTIIAIMAAIAWGNNVNRKVYSRIFEKYRSHFDSKDVASKVFLVALRRSGALDGGNYWIVAEDDEGTMYAVTAAAGETEDVLADAVQRAAVSVVAGLKRKTVPADAE